MKKAIGVAEPEKLGDDQFRTILRESQEQNDACLEALRQGGSKTDRARDRATYDTVADGANAEVGERLRRMADERGRRREEGDRETATSEMLRRAAKLYEEVIEALQKAVQTPDGSSCEYHYEGLVIMKDQVEKKMFRGEYGAGRCDQALFDARQVGRIARALLRRSGVMALLHESEETDHLGTRTIIRLHAGV